MLRPLSLPPGGEAAGEALHVERKRVGMGFGDTKGTGGRQKGGIRVSRLTKVQHDASDSITRPFPLYSFTIAGPFKLSV